MRILLAILILSLYPGEENILEWKSSAFPSKESVERYNNSSATKEWMVIMRNRKPYAKLYNNREKRTLPAEIKQDKVPWINSYANYAFTKVEDGWLLGYDHGEFGGELYWLSENSEDSYLMLKENIKQFLKIGDRIFAIEGYSHLSFDDGQILELKKKNGKWVAEQFRDLKTSPSVALIDKKAFIITFSDKVIKVTLDKKTTDILPKGVWNSYYFPNSMYKYKDNLYIGVRGGVIQVDMSEAKNHRWLTKK